MAGTLRREARVRRRAEFTRAYDRGLKRHGRFMTVFLMPTEGVSRVGVSATRKLGSAVVRNRAKRRVRALFRAARPAPGVDVIVIPRRELLDAPFDSLEVEFRHLVTRRPGGAAPASRSDRAGVPRPDSHV
jgi:ribonuclease P protein component